MRGRAVAARVAHNHEVVGSNPTPATNFYAPYNIAVEKALLNSLLKTLLDFDLIY